MNSFKGTEIRKIIRKAYDKYDEDNSGALDFEELDKLINDVCLCLGLEEFEKKELTDIMTLFDEDGDGSISFEELVSHIEPVLNNLLNKTRHVPGNGNSIYKYNGVSSPNFINNLGKKLRLFEKLNKTQERRNSYSAKSFTFIPCLPIVNEKINKSRKPHIKVDQDFMPIKN